MESKNRGGDSQQKWQLSGVREQQLVEVPGVGGYIVRSTSKKDRHSKVYTARGLRDRRVRLAAHTAIQFYDVQDRLGYDRPSKAVDWLIQNAKAAIDCLDELPRRSHPPYMNVDAADEEAPAPEMMKLEDSVLDVKGNSGEDFFSPLEINDAAMAGTIKSLQEGSSFQINCTPDRFMPSTSGHVQDLSLSLQSFHDHILAQGQHRHGPQNSVHPNTLQTFYSGNVAAANIAQNAAASVTWPPGGNGSGEFMFDMAARQPQHPEENHGHMFAQREPLQSSNFACIRSWMDPMQYPSSPSTPAGANVLISAGENGGFLLGFDPVAARVQREAEQSGTAYKLHFASSERRNI